MKIIIIKKNGSAHLPCPCDHLHLGILKAARMELCLCSGDTLTLHFAAVQNSTGEAAHEGQGDLRGAIEDAVAGGCVTSGETAQTISLCRSSSAFSLCTENLMFLLKCHYRIVLRVYKVYTRWVPHLWSGVLIPSSC